MWLEQSESREQWERGQRGCGKGYGLTLSDAGASGEFGSYLHVRTLSLAAVLRIHHSVARMEANQLGSPCRVGVGEDWGWTWVVAVDVVREIWKSE